MATPPKQRAQQHLASRAKAFRQTFLATGVDGAIALEDLAKFCRAHETTFHADPRVSAILEGRREVWLRIQHHLKLTDEQLWKMYGNPTLSNFTSEPGSDT